jgi:branched-subunit amino acid aminotransferase/4-amino-4-deoxychorismate lyase
VSIVCLNGEFLAPESARIAATDAGFLLGDGAFETIRVEEGQLLFHREHFARLDRALRVLEIPTHHGPEELLAMCQQVIDANELNLARLRVTVSRGPVRGLPAAGGEGEATLFIAATPMDPGIRARREQGIRAVLSNIARNHRSPLASIKSLSYAESLLARREAVRLGFDEALLLNTDGRLAEAAMANVFVVREGIVQTPPVREGALPGIIRGALLRHAGDCGLRLEEAPLHLSDLVAADEVAVTNTMLLVMPVVAVGERLVGDGRPGPVTRGLLGVAEELVAAQLSAYED